LIPYALLSMHQEGPVCQGATIPGGCRKGTAPGNSLPTPFVPCPALLQVALCQPGQGHIPMRLGKVRLLAKGGLIRRHRPVDIALGLQHATEAVIGCGVERLKTYGCQEGTGCRREV